MNDDRCKPSTFGTTWTLGGVTSRTSLKCLPPLDSPERIFGRISSSQSSARTPMRRAATLEKTWRMSNRSGKPRSIEQYKKDGPRPPCIDLDRAILGFNIDNTAAYQAIEDSKALHARRWQTKEGMYRIKRRALPDVRDAPLQDDNAAASCLYHATMMDYVAWLCLASTSLMVVMGRYYVLAECF